ncbi:MAG: cell division protein FtsZ [Pseudomonadota bacterium]
MVLNLKEPNDLDLRARITVFGVGGAGGNAVNNMIEKKLEGVEFIAANTDAQALKNSKASRSIQLGTGVTRGLGAGSKPDVGMTAAEESMEEIANHLDGCHMCFITGGMGGGTGTGAAPVVAKVAREMGILTVGVVTKPFHFEGARRMMLAEAGVDEMQKYVDTLIVIPNQNLFQVASERTTFVEAFMMADDVLYQGVQGVTDLMVRPGMINLDFADVRSVMEEMGKAMMGTGEAEGETRAIDAAEKAIANPLLDEVSLKGAKGVLINITGGYDLTLFEMDEAANRIKDEVDNDALIKFGSAIDPDMEGKMRVSVVATGIDAENAVERVPIEPAPRRRPAVTDATGISALRGALGRATGQSRPPAPPSRTEWPTRSTPSPEAAQQTAEAAPEPEAAQNPAPEAPVARSASQRAAAATTPPASEPLERKAAVAPSPADIRARAEEVRQRALDARARRQEEPNPARDEASAMFDIDQASLDTGSIEQQAQPQDSAGLRADTAMGMPRRGFAERGNAGENGSAAGRGLFTINKLIHRVAGGGQAADPRLDRADQNGADRERAEDDDGDIPAFLRRQAN